ncbi:MAG: hypothetical protein AAF219_07830 [Myxococcota bacterium]
MQSRTLAVVVGCVAFAHLPPLMAEATSLECDEAPSGWGADEARTQWKLAAQKASQIRVHVLDFPPANQGHVDDWQWAINRKDWCAAFALGQRTLEHLETVEVDEGFIQAKVERMEGWLEDLTPKKRQKAVSELLTSARYALRSAKLKDANAALNRAIARAFNSKNSLDLKARKRALELTIAQQFSVLLNDDGGELMGLGIRGGSISGGIGTFRSSGVMDVVHSAPLKRGCPDYDPMKRGPETSEMLRRVRTALSDTHLRSTDLEDGARLLDALLETKDEPANFGAAACAVLARIDEVSPFSRDVVEKLTGARLERVESLRKERDVPAEWTTHFDWLLSAAKKEKTVYRRGYPVAFVALGELLVMLGEPADELEAFSCSIGSPKLALRGGRQRLNVDVEFPPKNGRLGETPAITVVGQLRGGSKATKNISVRVNGVCAVFDDPADPRTWRVKVPIKPTTKELTVTLRSPEGTRKLKHPIDNSRFFLGPRAVALSRDGRTAFVADQHKGMLHAVNLRSGERQWVGFGLPRGPKSLAVHADGRLFIASEFHDSLLAWDPRTRDLTAISNSKTHRGPEFSGLLSVALTPDGRRAVVVRSSAMMAIDIETGSRTPLPFPTKTENENVGSFRAVAAHSNGRDILVATDWPEALWSFDLETETARLVSGGARERSQRLRKPESLALNRSGSHAFIADSKADAIISVDLSSGVQNIVSSASVGGLARPSLSQSTATPKPSGC